MIRPWASEVVGKGASLLQKAGLQPQAAGVHLAVHLVVSLFKVCSFKVIFWKQSMLY